MQNRGALGMLKVLNFVAGVVLAVVTFLGGAAAFAYAAPEKVDWVYQLTIRETIAERYRDQCRFGTGLMGYGESRTDAFCGCMTAMVYSLSVQEIVLASRDYRVLTEQPATRVCNQVHLLGIAPAGSSI
jgi:hypothetical protein